jgi:hypothetical protein
MTKAKPVSDPEDDDARTEPAPRTSGRPYAETPRALAEDDGEPGLSFDEYLERRRELEAKLAALAARLVASRRFPRVMYHATQLPRVVATPAERQALGSGWQPTPVEVP